MPFFSSVKRFPTVRIAAHTASDFSRAVGNAFRDTPKPYTPHTLHYTSQDKGFEYLDNFNKKPSRRNGREIVPEDMPPYIPPLESHGHAPTGNTGGGTAAQAGGTHNTTSGGGESGLSSTGGGGGDFSGGGGGGGGGDIGGEGALVVAATGAAVVAVPAALYTATLGWIDLPVSAGATVARAVARKGASKAKAETAGTLAAVATIGAMAGIGYGIYAGVSQAMEDRESKKA